MAGEVSVEKGNLVLVVDDDQDARNILQRTLQQAGFEVAVAVDGAEALRLVPELGIGVVLLDVRMPRLSGIDVLKHLVETVPGICIMMVTAVRDTETAVAAMKLGAYDYVTKPFNRDNVVLAVQRAVERRDLWRENERHRLDLEDKVARQADRLQSQFAELVETLAREHTLLYQLAAHQKKDASRILSKLPPELRQPMSSVDEFRDALIRILTKP
ncbi:MAG: response regulator [Dehalococcoidales bacterium]